MSSAWAAALAAGVTCAVVCGGLIWRGGRLVAILEQLTRIAADHETRIRGLEDADRTRPRRHAR